MTTYKVYDGNLIQVTDGIETTLGNDATFHDQLLSLASQLEGATQRGDDVTSIESQISLIKSYQAQLETLGN